MKCRRASNASCFRLLAQQCPFVNVNKNMVVNGDPEEAVYGNVLRFSCKSKLDILDGPSEIYCNEDGEWSGNAPRCIGKAVSEEQKGLMLGSYQRPPPPELPFQAQSHRFPSDRSRFSLIVPAFTTNV